jgi:hypothetical protein
MIATQYEIGLPRDYDMTVVRDRVATRGHALDDYPGLGIKAYLIRDVADGASSNAYAPFYLWTDEAAAGRFLWGGDGFGGIVRDFGRPRVRTWIGGRYLTGLAHGTTPTLAVKTTVTIPHDADPQDGAAHADAHTQAMVDAEEGLHSAAWAIDPARWELVVFTLHATRDRGPSASTQTPSGLGAGWKHADSTSYEVLHLCTPEIADLA